WINKSQRAARTDESPVPAALVLWVPLQDLVQRDAVGGTRNRPRPGSPALILGNVAGRRVPSQGFQPVQVIDDLAVLDGHLIDQLLVAVQAAVDHVGEAELTLFQAQHGDISNSP